MHPYLRLVRAGNLGVSFLGTVVGGLAAAGVGIGLTRFEGLALLLAAASTTCVTAGGNVLNDVLDQATDRTNHPDRPLVTGEIRPATARGLAVTLFLAAGLLVIPIVPSEPLVGVILAICLVLLLGYEFLGKAEGIGGNLLVAVLTGGVFLYGGAAVGELVAVAPFAAMAFLATLSREIIKDMEDAGGDVDRRTLPRVHGMSTAAWAARGAVAGAILLSPLPILTMFHGASLAEAAYFGVVAVADAIFVISIWWLPDRLHREQGLSKGAMTVALLAFLATAFR
ncbi:MAG: geranylgeranylglycerol-phosphate geranylgeranyltransferase [Thermoplasmata archaeon]|nr:geranylgeranylglycerol-phosphate geranylgeranyltransferase [Thermoplasmata archaeon]